MKTLFLARHAEAGFQSDNHSDMNRKLTAHGEKSAQGMGKSFVQRKIKLDKICASSALRTTNTAQLVADQMQYDQDAIRLEKNLYDTNVFVLLDFINRLDDQLKNVLLINHNPTITDFVGYLTDSHFATMKPATLVELTFDVPYWKMITKGSATLVRWETF